METTAVLDDHKLGGASGGHLASCSVAMVEGVDARYPPFWTAADSSTITG